jgi:hypothetical protein
MDMSKKIAFAVTASMAAAFSTSGLLLACEGEHAAKAGTSRTLAQAGDTTQEKEMSCGANGCGGAGGCGASCKEGEKCEAKDCKGDKCEHKCKDGAACKHKHGEKHEHKAPEAKKKGT